MKKMKGSKKMKMIRSGRECPDRREETLEDEDGEIDEEVPKIIMGARYAMVYRENGQKCEIKILSRAGKATSR